jgi:hypothetical protein
VRPELLDYVGIQCDCRAHDCILAMPSAVKMRRSR